MPESHHMALNSRGFCKSRHIFIHWPLGRFHHRQTCVPKRLGRHLKKQRITTKGWHSLIRDEKNESLEIRITIFVLNRIIRITPAVRLFPARLMLLSWKLLSRKLSPWRTDYWKNAREIVVWEKSKNLGKWRLVKNNNSELVSVQNGSKNFLLRIADWKCRIPVLATRLITIYGSWYHNIWRQQGPIEFPTVCFHGV